MEAKIDPILQWDGSYNAYDQWTFEPFSYYPGDPNYAGDDFLVDWSEGASHLVQVDMWGSPMLDWAGDPMFADYTPDFLF
ncbi:hypothetical protein [Lyngbya sp. CCY1209]|uniref:hypothetical protein n=1 Tax=Lyngbya sp. CCY1209 TaxID=2886103 RepID=UPI002D209BF4|nr:hypothetical protein [Lyngbya sp. CCY1209]MEB3885080.1 hypothetical protein [Lyngbya sp. CCY1209]